MMRIVVVEDHTLVRETVVKVVSAQPDFEVVGQAGMAEEAFDVIRRNQPDLALLDVSMPGMDGFDLATRLKELQPDVRLIFLTMHEDDRSLQRAMSVGVDGYLPKTASVDEVLRALRAVAEGGSYLSRDIARRMMDLASGRASDGVNLTERELEILRLMAAGVRPAQVAERLFLSLKTVKNHLTSIYAKLGVETAAQAVAEAYRLGIVRPDSR
ncbi:MAG: response regulator transcription factor [Actinobacteria bacterium]|nr:response regulator transcription factor [Actinomycetota bacterium]